jgi:hypothetical protein
MSASAPDAKQNKSPMRSSKTDTSQMSALSEVFARWVADAPQLLHSARRNCSRPEGPSFFCAVFGTTEATPATKTCRPGP